MYFELKRVNVLILLFWIFNFLKGSVLFAKGTDPFEKRTDPNEKRFLKKIRKNSCKILKKLVYY